MGFLLYKVVANMVKKEYNNSNSDYSEPICIFEGCVLHNYRKNITGDKKWENILEQMDFVERLTKY